MSNKPMTPQQLKETAQKAAEEISKWAYSKTAGCSLNHKDIAAIIARHFESVETVKEVPCTHEWFQGACVHCERTVNQVRECSEAANHNLVKAAKSLSDMVMDTVSRGQGIHPESPMAQAAVHLNQTLAASQPASMEDELAEALKEYLKHPSIDGAPVRTKLRATLCDLLARYEAQKGQR